MKRIAIFLPLFMLMALPLAASAHQHASYTIGGKTYNIVIGSLNEPVAVDDKTGLDLTVTQGGGGMSMSADGDMDGPAAASTPVMGLESTLKVELQAGGKKKTLDISPVYGKPGSYSAPFYPTVATTLSYRIFGTVNNTPVDLTFACIPAGATKAADDNTPKEISAGVTRTSIGGGFTCPTPKEDMGFPEKSASLASLASPSGLGMGSLGLSAAALAVAFLALRRKK